MFLRKESQGTWITNSMAALYILGMDLLNYTYNVHINTLCIKFIFDAFAGERVTPTDIQFAYNQISRL